jgi:hypothetical protein
MEKNIDTLARGLVDGTESCAGCSELERMVQQVRSGEMDFEEFKTILALNKESLLKKTV